MQQVRIICELILSSYQRSLWWLPPRYAWLRKENRRLKTDGPRREEFLVLVVFLQGVVVGRGTIQSWWVGNLCKPMRQWKAKLHAGFEWQIISIGLSWYFFNFDQMTMFEPLMLYKTKWSGSPSNFLMVWSNCWRKWRSFAWLDEKVPLSLLFMLVFQLQQMHWFLLFFFPLGVVIIFCPLAALSS